MKQLIIFAFVFLNTLSCTADTFRHYQGHVYQDRQPMAGVEVYEQDHPENKTQTDKQGFFSLAKRPESVSSFLMLKKDNVLIDSIPVMGTSGGEKMNYYFTDQRTDTLFVQRR